MDRLAGPGFALLLQFEFGAPKPVYAVFELLGRTQFAAVSAIRVVAEVAERLDSELSSFGIGVLHLEIGGGRQRDGQARPPRRVDK